jgi:hypothetical protein
MKYSALPSARNLAASISVRGAARTLPLFLAFAFVIGCAARPPADYLLQLGREHPTYPPATHKCALGEDSGSREAALDRAIAGVMRLVQSSVQTELENVVEVLIQDEVVSDRETIRQKITRSSEFAHEELIREVDSAEWEGTFRAYACLDRAETAGVLAREAQGVLKQHQEAVRLAGAAEGAKEFAAQYREAQRYTSEVLRYASVLSYLQKSSAAALQNSLAAGVALHKKAQGFRNTATINIAVRGIDGVHQTAVESAFRQGIEDLGLRSSAGGGGCEAGESTHVLEVQAAQTCTAGSLTLYCDLGFDLKLKACGGTGASTAKLGGKAFRGTNNQFIEASARAKSWAKLSGDGLGEQLKDLVGTEIPLG